MGSALARQVYRIAQGKTIHCKRREGASVWELVQKQILAMAGLSGLIIWGRNPQKLGPPLAVITTM